ncbi:MAG: cupin domain-containing protein [Gemmatimonadales bacterium]
MRENRFSPPTPNSGIEPPVRSEIECRFAMGAPWGIRMDHPSEARFYLVSRGGGWFEADQSERATPFQKGDLIATGRGVGHQFKSSPEHPVICLDGVLASRSHRGGNVKCGGGGSPTSIVSGTFELRDHSSLPVAAGLPTTLHIRAASAPPEWFDTLRSLDEDLARRTPGSEVVAAEVTDVLLGKLLGGVGASAGDIAVRDLRIVRAMSTVNAAPENSWSVVELAKLARMSRSRFTSRFRDVAGLAPMRYVQKTRMIKAAGYLSAGRGTLADIATRTGYESDVALSKAFKRFYGMSPGAYRKSRRAVS